jgi:hypothetical protein
MDARPKAMPSRRQFLETAAKAGLAAPAASLLGACAHGPTGPDLSDPSLPLAARFPDLRRHFVFEYYPWYGGAPDYLHWSADERRPPPDLASNYYPRLGPYDSRLRTVVEQHAQWMADAGVGAVNLSWWGQKSYEDRAVHEVMDVMRDHDLKVAFHLEPYGPERGANFGTDVQYLLREYGEKRGFDTLLVLRNADGREGPVFKGFGTILFPDYTDCHGVKHAVLEYTKDEAWKRTNDDVHRRLRGAFDHVTILSDSWGAERVRAAGFDGIAVYDAFVRPSEYRALAEGASAERLLFSFSVNAGYDGIHLRDVEPDSCYVPSALEPAVEPVDWSRPEERERVAEASRARIVESFRETIAAQTDPAFANARAGFLLVYVSTFNEWHEGTQFEPMKDAADLTTAERAFGYHNPRDGGYRLSTLKSLLAGLA